MVGARIADAETLGRGIEYKNCLIVALLLDYKYTFLPELYEIFGQDRVLKFIDLFGGTTISIPSQEDFLTTIRDVGIYLDMKHKRKDVSVRKIADKYKISKASALRIFKEIRAKVDSLDGLPIDDLFLSEDKNGTKEKEEKEGHEGQCADDARGLECRR